MKSAQIVIIGGGIVGCSIACNLAKRGCRDVTVLEKELLGQGSTARSQGGIRQQFPWETEVRMSQESLRFFLGFRDELGIDVDLRQVGYLFLLGTEQQLQQARRDVALQRSLGVPTELLSPDQVKAMLLEARVDDLMGATFCPTDGFLGPHEATQGFAAGARKLGVRFLEETEVTGIEVTHGRVRAVSTSAGKIPAEVAINAAGPYAAHVARMAGVALPVVPKLRHIFVTAPFDGIPGPLPLIIDNALGFSCRREGPGILLNAFDATPSPDCRIDMDWGVLPALVARATARFPILEGARIMTGWAGLREITPDERAIIGWMPEPEGLFCAVGFSGHGLMHAPATGELVAELLLEGRTHLDISSLSPNRFWNQGQ